MKILGISSYYHDSASALISDGKILSAAQEERFTRIKHDASFPFNSIKFILNENKLSLNQIDNVVFYDKPFLKFERLLETYIAKAPYGFKSFYKAIPIWIKEKLFLKNMLKLELEKISKKKFDVNKILFSEHHFSHAASAFFPSPYNEALILILDGVGEWSTSTVAIGSNNNLKILKEINFPHSIGLLYSAFTYYTGFKVNSGEYKLMGLAPYGQPIYEKLIFDKLIDLKDDGSFRLNQSFFDYSVGLKMINKKFEKLFGQPSRKPEIEKLTQFHMNIASSAQIVIEKIILKITKSLFDEYKIPNLCLAGGVALNCVANGKILKQNLFKNIWVQPASGDAGGAIGSAYAAYHFEFKKKRKIIFPDNMQGSYLGNSYSDNQIISVLDKCKASYVNLKKEDMIYNAALSISKGKAVGWFQGKMEFGPRALGSRSILADPRSSSMQKLLKLKVKFRESFRPFPPSVLFEDLNDWYKMDIPSPYMLFVAELRDKLKKNMSDVDKKLFGIEKLNLVRSDIPAVTHVDYSSRIQTVHKETNPLYYSLIKKFKEITGTPIIINTSFNIRGEPIVCTPYDAFKCFMGTDLDVLIMGNLFLDKKNQNHELLNNYSKEFTLD